VIQPSASPRARTQPHMDQLRTRTVVTLHNPRLQGSCTDRRTRRKRNRRGVGATNPYQQKAVHWLGRSCGAKKKVFNAAATPGQRAASSEFCPGPRRGESSAVA
jgi:hypothetical protein